MIFIIYVVFGLAGATVVVIIETSRCLRRTQDLIRQQGDFLNRAYDLLIKLEKES